MIFKLTIENRDDVTIKYCLENILIFTDGSKDQNGHTFSGEELNEIAEPLPTYSSIFLAEEIAIYGRPAK